MTGIIKTKRLVLEPTVAAHALEVFAAVERSQRELAVWMPWAAEPRLEDTVAWAARAAQAAAEGAEASFTLRHDGEVAGHVSLVRKAAVHDYAELGYWLRSDLSGSGLITEAAAAVVRFGFGEQGLHRIELRAAVDNAASIRVAEKLGFQREGVLRGTCLGPAGTSDAYMYGLLATDPQPS
jgi:ribosomal-protein-serine acetyltransferase